MLGPVGVGASMIKTRNTKDGEIRTRSTNEGGRVVRKERGKKRLVWEHYGSCDLFYKRRLGKYNGSRVGKTIFSK